MNIFFSPFFKVYPLLSVIFIELKNFTRFSMYKRIFTADNEFNFQQN